MAGIPDVVSRLRPNLPLVTAALAHAVAPTTATAVAVGVSPAAAAVGWWLANRAGPRWGTRARAGP